MTTLAVSSPILKRRPENALPFSRWGATWHRFVRALLAKRKWEPHGEGAIRLANPQSRCRFCGTTGTDLCPVYEVQYPYRPLLVICWKHLLTPSNGRQTEIPR